MSRPNVLGHPLVTLRTAAGLGRQQFAAHLRDEGLRVSAVYLEKVERGERRFTEALRLGAQRATGVCPGWFANPRRPVHTADGHRYDRTEFERWRHWQDLPAAPDAGVPAGGHGLGGRALGPLHRKDCCPSPAELLDTIPMDSGDLAPRVAKTVQRRMHAAALAARRARLVDLARGAAATVRTPGDEIRLLEAMAALRKLFPDAHPLPDPRDAAG